MSDSQATEGRGASLEKQYGLPETKLEIVDVLRAVHALESRSDTRLGRMEATLINIEHMLKEQRDKNAA